MAAGRAGRLDDSGVRRLAGLVSILVLAAGACAAPSISSVPGVTPSPARMASPLATEPPAQTAPAAHIPFAALPTEALEAATAADLQAVLEDMVASGAPDAIAAVVSPEGTWAGAAGIGGPDGRMATPDDEFAIASVTKIFTAALVMRLAEQGLVDLDAPLATYLDGIHDANGASVRQALGMRSGMADFGPDAAVEIAADPAHHWTTAELVARFPDAVGTPGAAYGEASANYILLALAVEQVTGGPFADALRAEVLDPVGATRIMEQGAGTDTPRPWALPTEAHIGAFDVDDLGAGGAISCISSASYGPGSGSIASDAPSLAAWTWHLFAGDILQPASLEAMLPVSDSHGLGIEALGGLGGAAIGRTGGKTGYGTILAVFPDEQTVVVLLVNDPNFVVESYVARLLQASAGT